MSENYPRIVSISDSFGSTFTGSAGQGFRPVDTGHDLRPGDSVTFKFVGEDPKGRGLSWRTMIGNSSIELPSVNGTTAEVTLQITNQHVRDDATVVFQLTALDTEFHRHGTYDEQAEFYYRILPPS